VRRCRRKVAAALQGVTLTIRCDVDAATAHSNKGQTAVDYSGDRTTPAMVSWIQKRMRGPYQLLHSEEQAQEFLAGGGFRVLALIPGNEEASAGTPSGVSRAVLLQSLNR
jgi:hypothetical protein